MRHIKKITRYLIIIIICFYTAKMVNAQEQIGWVLSKSSGKAELITDGLQPIELVKGAPIYNGYTLSTKNKCLLKIQFEDESIITVNENTEMLIQRKKENMVQPFVNKNTNFSFDFAMKRGETRFHITKRKMAKQYLLKSNKLFKAVTVKTPTVCIGVRGSEYSVKIVEKTSILAFIPGVAQAERTEVITYDDTRLLLYQLDSNGEYLYKIHMNANMMYSIEKDQTPKEISVENKVQELITMLNNERRYQLFSKYTDQILYKQLEELAIDESIEQPNRIIDIQTETSDSERENRVKKLPLYPDPPSNSP